MKNRFFYFEIDGGVNRVEKAFKVILGILLLIGIIMVLSASYMHARDKLGSSFYFFYRQIAFCGFGLCACYFLSRTRFQFWLKYSYVLNFMVTILLLITLFSSIGINVKGSYRWINLGIIFIQPGEFIKYSILLVALDFFDNFFRYTQRQKIIKGMMIILPMVLLLCQPDFGTFAICMFGTAFVCFMSEFPRKWFYGLLVSGIFLGIVAALSAPYRMQRIMTYLDPWKDPQNSGFQIIQSYLAFANGSIWGQGIGKSIEKLFYLPESYNDFIFSVIAEETGFIGVLLLVLLFLAFVFFGLKMAIAAKTRKAVIVMTSIVVTIGFQAFLNMAVVLGLLPTKGLNLPFISYGGSSLMASLCAIGLMFAAKNITFSQQNETSNTNEKLDYSNPLSR